MEKCCNCGRDIGNLETPMIWRNVIVCEACNERLIHPTQRPAPYRASAPPTRDVIASGVVHGLLSFVIWGAVILILGSVALAVVVAVVSPR